MATITQPSSLMCVIICGWRKTLYPSTHNMAYQLLKPFKQLVLIQLLMINLLPKH